MEPHGNSHLKEQSANGIQQHIMKTAGSRRDKTLVKFIKAPGGESSQQSQSGPENSPSLGCRKSGAPGEERKRTEKSVTAKMRGLADQEMNLLKPVFRNCSKQGLQDFFQNTPGVLGGKHVSGEHGQHAEPDERRNPRQEFSRRCSGRLLVN